MTDEINTPKIRTSPLPPFVKAMMLDWWKTRVARLEDELAIELAREVVCQPRIDHLAQQCAHATDMVAKMEAEACT